MLSGRRLYAASAVFLRLFSSLSAEGLSIDVYRGCQRFLHAGFVDGG